MSRGHAARRHRRGRRGEGGGGFVAGAVGIEFVRVIEDIVVATNRLALAAAGLLCRPVISSNTSCAHGGWGAEACGRQATVRPRATGSGGGI